MDYLETKISGETKYHGVIVDVTLDEVELHTGEHTKREVVHHPGGVTVLPVDENGMAYLVRQFRYPFGKMVLECPAGKLEPGEEPRAAALRELSEETGLECGELVELGAIYATPGYCTETLHIYLALDLTQKEAHLDPGEYLNVERYPLDVLTKQCMAGEIRDGKTNVAVLKAARIMEERNGKKSADC